MDISYQQSEHLVIVSHREKYVLRKETGSKFVWYGLLNKVSSYYYAQITLINYVTNKSEIIEKLTEDLEEALNFIAKISDVFESFEIKILTFDKDYDDVFIDSVVKLWKEADE